MKIVEPRTGKRFIRRNTRRAGQVLGDLGRAMVWHTSGRRRFSLEAATELADQHDWCFIVGCNNSGTSLTQQILSRSASVSSFQQEGQRYTAALPRAVKRGHERVWTEFLDELRMTEDDSLAAFPRLLHDWTISLERPLQNLILEKTTANVVRMRWLQKAFSNARFIVLVRDGYAVSEGIYRKGEKDIRRAAKHWNKVYELAVEDSKHINHLMFLKYEDLVAKPQQTAERLADFTGIPQSVLVEGFAAKYSLHNPEDSKGIKDFNAPSRARLDKSDIQIIQSEARSTLDHFDYSAP